MEQKSIVNVLCVQRVICLNLNLSIINAEYRLLLHDYLSIYSTVLYSMAALLYNTVEYKFLKNGGRGSSFTLLKLYICIVVHKWTKIYCGSSPRRGGSYSLALLKFYRYVLCWTKNCLYACWPLKYFFICLGDQLLCAVVSIRHPRWSQVVNKLGWLIDYVLA